MTPVTIALDQQCIHAGWFIDTTVLYIDINSGLRRRQEKLLVELCGYSGTMQAVRFFHRMTTTSGQRAVSGMTGRGRGGGACGAYRNQARLFTLILNMYVVNKRPRIWWQYCEGFWLSTEWMCVLFGQPYSRHEINRKLLWCWARKVFCQCKVKRTVSWLFFLNCSVPVCCLVSFWNFFRKPTEIFSTFSVGA